MRRLLAKPLTWMVLAEIVVVAAFVAVAWHMVAGVAHTAVEPVVVRPSTAAPDDGAAPDVSPDLINPPDPGVAPLLPGLKVDPALWRVRLAGLNEAEAQVEALEWRIVHSAMDTVRRYVDSVVVPAVERAEARSG